MCTFAPVVIVIIIIGITWWQFNTKFVQRNGVQLYYSWWYLYFSSWNPQTVWSSSWRRVAKSWCPTGGSRRYVTVCTVRY